MEKLPEKWLLEVTEESLDAVNEYRKLKEYSGSSLKNVKSREVISFEDFKRLVLKESTSDKPKKPELEEALKSNEFKVGDWVKCKSTRYVCHKSGTNEEVFQIKKFKDGDLTKIQSSLTSSSGWINKCDLVLATPEEIAKVTGKKEEFIKGKWYKADCNEIYYRFSHIDGAFFCNDAQINPTSSTMAGIPNGYWTDNRTGDLKKYFKPSNLVSDKIINIFLPKSKEEPMNTYGLKVGDVIPGKVGTAWCRIEGNCWEGIRKTGNICGDSSIHEFKVIDGTTWFRREIGKHTNFWIKAEGFKEFMDNFDKPKVAEPMKQELTSLPEKWCIAVIPKNEEALQYYNKKCGSTCYGLKSAACSKGYMLSHNFEGESILKENRVGASFHSFNPIGIEITFEQFKKWVLKEDKPKFEVGKWYQYNAINNWVLKCSKVTLNSFYYKDCINLTNKIYSIVSDKHEGSYAINQPNLGKEVPLSEIQQYLPEGHVDKIKTEKVMDMKEIQEECKRRFPVGSKVKNTAGDVIVLKQDEVVYSILKNYIYTHDGGGCLYNNGEYATLISLPEKENKSLVGRWVKWNISTTNGKGYKPGDYCLITKILEDGKFQLDNSTWHWDPNRFNNKDVELMPEGFIPPNTTSKIEVNTPFNIGSKAIYETEKVTMTKEELLAEAKRRYPIGTKVRSLFHITNPILEIDDTYFKTCRKDGIHVGAKDSNYMVVVYENGEWAEIVSKPEEKFSKAEKEYVKKDVEFSTRIIGYQYGYKKQTGKSGHQKPIVLKKTKTNFKLLTKNKL